MHPQMSPIKTHLTLNGKINDMTFGSTFTGNTEAEWVRIPDTSCLAYQAYGSELRIYVHLSSMQSGHLSLCVVKWRVDDDLVVGPVKLMDPGSAFEDIINREIAGML